MNSLARARQAVVLASRLTCKTSQLGGQARRLHQDEQKPKFKIFDPEMQMLLEQGLHGMFVKQFGFPSFFSRLFCNFYVQNRMRSIDSSFDQEQFRSQCKEASIIFCNLAHNFNEDHGQSCRELMTEQAHAQLVDLLQNAPPDMLEKLKFSDRDIAHFNFLFITDFKKGDRKYVEATFSILMKPRIFDKDLSSNQSNLTLNPSNLDLILIRFLRDYTDGSSYSNTDWIISYFDCKFVKTGDYKDVTDLFKSFK